MSENNDESALSKITKDRERTNILHNQEQAFLAYLVQRVPKWINSDGLTAIGFVGTLITAGSFFLAKYIDSRLLLVGIIGFLLNWYGDSLDGRLAYYRNQPRKWYGFSLDFSIDWVSNIFIGLGFIVYVDGFWELWGYGFVTLYGWSMMTALLRYKIVNKYTIDSGLLGPTEVRIILIFILALEIILPGSIGWCGGLICVILLYITLSDFVKLLKMADLRDKEERKNKTE